jgi:hypothetical protein
MIKVNYVIKALLNEELKNKRKVDLDDESDFMDYFKLQYSHYVKNCADTFRISIKLKIDDVGSVSIDSISPNATRSAKKEVYRVIESISKLKNVKDSFFNFNYRILCRDELEIKK